MPFYTHLDLRVGRTLVYESHRRANDIPDQFAPLRGHPVGQSDCRHPPWLRHPNDTLGMPSELVKILKEEMLHVVAGIQ